MLASLVPVSVCPAFGGASQLDRGRPDLSSTIEPLKLARAGNDRATAISADYGSEHELDKDTRTPTRTFCVRFYTVGVLTLFPILL
jgi:hypothetical protein